MVAALAISDDSLKNRLTGVLLGTALGDALGVPMEGMSGAAIARAFPRIDRFFMLGRTGIVSDDTEQSALVAQSLARGPRDVAVSVRALRRALVGWFLRLPWGIGLGTLRACLRMCAGLERTGVPSAGNGAAMRAAIVGAFFHDDAAARRTFSDEIARVTHTDARAVEGARFVAEVAALAMRSACEDAAGVDRHALLDEALCVVSEPSLRGALGKALALARSEAPLAEAARVIGTSGFVVHSVALAAFAFARYGDAPQEALVETIRAGGDTDSNAAIVGAWLGALHGARALPQPLMSRLHDGPFGPTHLRALAADLAHAARGQTEREARYSWALALARNVLLYPVVLWSARRAVWSLAQEKCRR